MVARPGNGDSSRQSHCRESTGENRENRGELRKGRPSIRGWIKLLILCYLCLLLFNSFDHSHRRSPRAPVAESWSRDPGTGTARAKAIAGNQQERTEKTEGSCARGAHRFPVGLSYSFPVTSVCSCSIHLITATAEAPIRNSSGSGFSISMRTGNRCAM